MITPLDHLRSEPGPEAIVIAQGGSSLMWHETVWVAINVPGLVLMLLAFMLVSVALWYLFRERLRPWFRFSLKTLFIVTTVVALAVCGLAVILHRTFANTDFYMNWKF